MSKIPALGWLGAFKLLALAAIPSLATALVFAHEVTSNRWLLLPLVLLYLITVCISYIVKIVWQQLAPKWMKQLADWIDIEVQSALSRYHKRYCRYLIYQHRDFDVKGLTTQGIYTLELEQVFVEVSIDPTPAHQANPDLLRLPDVLRQGEHSIWDYLSAEPLKMQHLVIIGPPGSGKTTLLKHIALTVINRKKARKHASNPYTLPFLLFLREYDEMIRDRADFSLVDAIDEHLKKWEKSIPVEWIMRRLIKGHCLVLLDGLDEIADAKTRHQMVDWVEHQMVIYGKNRFLITSRPHGYQSNPLSKAMVLEVHPFTPNQVELFVRSWYLTNEIMSSQKTMLVCV